MCFLLDAKNYGIKVYKNFQMKKVLSLGVGGIAKYYVLPKSLVEIKRTIELLTFYKIKYKVIGNGTNIIMSDNGYNGAIVSLVNCKGVFVEDNIFTVLAGTKLSEFCLESSRKGYSGVEKLIGIPSTVGGAITMNAGAFLSEISNNLISVDILKNDKFYRLSKDECKFSYRKSAFLDKKVVILSAKFALTKNSKSEIDKFILECIKKRNLTQPKGKSCGCIFKNTHTISAGKLIDSCNLKGFRVGDAIISYKHANFILNIGNATSKDVVLLIDYIKKKVNAYYGITLTEEVEFLGEF